ncbi:hypothetical protein KFJ24_12970 [Marinobacter sediminum]|uniref:hypothetical protein n=1 Tax=Marinobacter sediminum TaxID=256323 RepID=UPI00202EDEE6|nr:hypothetical protein [Marinobacter sediminum]MCM0613387.1 hypothetical protein [Marinobacter sediminum]
MEQTELKPGAYYVTTELADGSTLEGLSLLSPSGAFAVAFSDQDLTFGTLTFSSPDVISGTGTDYVLNESWELTSGSISGTVTSSETAELRATASGFYSDSTLQRENTYSDLGITLSDISGTYTMDEPGYLTSSVTIASDGTVTGSDQTGCVFNGQITIPDQSINVFEVDYSSSNCGSLSYASASDRNGDFSGIGSYDPSLQELEVVSRNGKIASIFFGTR